MADDIDVKNAAGATVNVPTLAPLIAANHADLAAILAKIIAAPSTEAKQDAANVLLTAIGNLLTTQAGYLDGLEGLLGPLATQTTLAAVLSALGTPMQQTGGSVALVSQGYTATATFTPAAAAYSANDIMDVAKEMTWVDKDGNAFGGGEMMITSAEMVISESSIQSGETSYTLQKFNAARATPLADNDASTAVVADAAKYMHRTDLGSPVDRGTILAVKTNGINEQITVPTTGKIVVELVTNGGFTATATARTVILHGMAG